MDAFDSVLGNRRSWSDRVWPWAKWGALLICVWSHVSMCSHLGTISENSGQTFVQTSTGHGYEVTAYSPEHRSPQLIHQFVLTWGTYSLTWDNSVTSANGKAVADQGQTVNGVRIPSRVWAGSLLLDQRIRQSWLVYLTQEIDFGPYLNGDKFRVLQFERLGQPQQVQPGLYTVDVEAFWTDFTRKNKGGERMVWNRRITVQAVPSMAQQISVEDGVHAQIVYKLLASGLKVVNIQSLSQETQPTQTKEAKP